jgi:hypothetical protein
MSPRGSGRTIVLAIMAALSLLAVWWFSRDMVNSFARMVGLEPVLTRLVGAPRITETTSLRPVDLILEASRWDTKRSDRWRLRMPAAYVTTMMGKTRPEETNAYYLELVAGSDEPAKVFHERTKPWRTEDRVIPPDHPRRSVMLVRLDGAVLVPAAEVSQRRFDRFEHCRKVVSPYDGLTELREPSDDGSDSHCSRRANNRLVIYVATDERRQHDVMITCTYNSSAIDHCSVEALVFHGWGVYIRRFDPKYLSQWRQIVRQVIGLLERHTIESTSGLPSTDFSKL